MEICLLFRSKKNGNNISMEDEYRLVGTDREKEMKREESHTHTKPKILQN